MSSFSPARLDILWRPGRSESYFLHGNFELGIMRFVNGTWPAANAAQIFRDEFLFEPMPLPNFINGFLISPHPLRFKS